MSNLRVILKTLWFFLKGFSLLSKEERVAAAHLRKKHTQKELLDMLSKQSNVMDKQISALNERQLASKEYLNSLFKLREELVRLKSNELPESQATFVLNQAYSPEKNLSFYSAPKNLLTKS